MAETKKTYLTTCCKVEPVVEGSDEGTNYYVCPGCDEPCDPKYVEIQTWDGAEFVQNALHIVEAIEASGDTPSATCVSVGLFGVAILSDGDSDFSATVVFEGAGPDLVLLPFDTPEGREALCRWMLHRRPERESEFEDALLTLADTLGIDLGPPDDVEGLYEELSGTVPGVCAFDRADDGSTALRIDLLDDGQAQVLIWKDSESGWTGRSTFRGRVLCQTASLPDPLQLLSYLLRGMRRASERRRAKLAELVEKLDEWETEDP